MTIVVRTRASRPAALAGAVRRVVSELDPDVPIANARTMDDVVAHSMARVSFTMLLLGIAAGMSLLLSVVGLYGVISYLVSQRRGEIGIRIALGAPGSLVGRMVVLQSVRLAALGVVLGLVGAIVSMRVLRSLLFEVSPTDPLTLGAVGALLIATATAAAYIPARRAATVDPMVALRTD
jgi:ABC-type antimicrobial peptide transport system permease subunit